MSHESLHIFSGEIPEGFFPVERDPLNDPRPNASFDVSE